jgi:hypothetical protein
MAASKPKLFAVLSQGNPDTLARSIEKHFPDDSYAFGRGQWLVLARGTTKGLSDKLGISDGLVGPGIVLSVNNYFGWADADIWEWLEANS